MCEHPSPCLRWRCANIHYLACGSDERTSITLPVMPTHFCFGVSRIVLEDLRSNSNKYCVLAKIPDEATGQEAAEGVSLNDLLEEYLL